MVDGANVVGSRPDGWWRDRAGAAARLHTRLALADSDDLASYAEIVLVLEGQARVGVPAGSAGGLTTVHAARDGDATIVLEASSRAQAHDVTVVTADRGLAMRVQAVGAATLSPGWLLDRL